MALAMDRFERLHSFLEDILANPQDDPSIVSKLQLKLERARPLFLALLETPPKDPKERQQLEKGSFTYVVTGTTYSAGPALAKEILFLSDAINASEDFSASLVSYGINAKPRSGLGRAESGLVVFLDERAALIQSLQAIWRGALSADERLAASGIQRVLEKETEELTRGKGAEVVIDAATERKGTWIEKIIDTLDKCKNEADSLRNSLRQPVPSNALATTASLHGASFSDETTQMRIQRFEEERRSLGQLLFLIGAGRHMAKNDIQLLLRQLSQAPSTDSAVVYILISLLAALDVSDPAAAQQLYPLFSDSSFVNKVTQTLASNWTVPHLKATVQLQWATFLDTAAHYVANFETDGGELVDTLVGEAIDAGVFAFLGKAVLRYKWDAELEGVWKGLGGEIAPLGGEVPVDAWFQEYVTEQLEILVLDVITSKFTALRKLRNREEDVVASSHRGGGHRAVRGAQDDRPLEVRHDLEAFFILIATIYRGAPDSGLKFWEEADIDEHSTSPPNPITAKLSSFLRWGAECRSSGMKRAYYEMVASLASGPRSATYAHELLAASSGSLDHNGASAAAFSWSTLFGALRYYLDNLPTVEAVLESGLDSASAQGGIPPEESPLLQSFVRVLRQVVAFSDVARATLYDNQTHRPVAVLFGLLGRNIDLDLKATLLGTIAAFSRPGGTTGVDVARRTWTALELSQILPTHAPMDSRNGAGLATSHGIFSGPGQLAAQGGILTELVQVEGPGGRYPQSTAFVELLNTLIHVPSTIEPLNTLIHVPSTIEPIRRGLEIDTQTIPDNLGAPQRAPGVDPYIKFVIEDVLLKAGERDYHDPRERWAVTDVCLEFVEKSLVSFDLGPFLAWAAVGGQRAASAPTSPLTQLLLHPGFDLLARILSASPLLENVFTIITAGLESIRNNLAGTPLFTSCMLRCMRILRRTLELQAPFLEVVLPSLAESTLPISQDKLNRLKSVVPVDQSLLYHSEAVVQIALLISCTEEDEIALLAVQILAVIAESPFFDVVQKFPEQSRVKLNRLVGLLQASSETLRILDGVTMRLEEDVPESDLDLGEWDGPNGEASGSIRQAIKSAILDLLLQSTQPGRPGPNIAHLLLGFNVQGRPDEMEIDDPEAADTQKTSLHVILDLLAENVSSNADVDVQLSILARHPTFAAKCYRLIRQLCLHKYTSAVLSRYLRNREKFFLTQTLALPFSVPAASQGALGAVQYSDRRQVVTSSSAVCAILQSEAWLLESTALELNVLAAGNDTRRQVELVGALFENPTMATDEDVPAYFDQGGLEQALPRMLEIFHSFDFAWEDSIQPNDYRLNFFAELKFDSCLQTDTTGCEVYDFGALLSLLGAARRELQNRGVLNTQAQQEEAKKETRAIVETLVIENHRREIQFARFHALRAWRSLLDITLTKAFHLLPAEGRHSLLLDLMSSILPPLAAQETDQAISELLSGAAVLLMTKLRDEGIRVVFLESADSVQSVSPERLHAVLRAILQAILQPGVSPVVRGNLYAVLLNYIQYSSKMASLSPALTRNLAAGSTNGDDSMSVADDLISLDGASTVGGTRRSSRKNALESGNFAVLQSAIDRLLPVICRDAAVGHEVWRTVAFTALDALVMVAEQGRAVGRVLSILTKQGYLQSFVASLKDAETDLQEALKPDPESLNALYIYEAQMSFLTRLASTREGAEKLMNAELLSRLAECDYLGARPLEEAAPMDFDGFLPPAIERHHQLLLPALQLVVGTLVSFGSDSAVATRQAIAFVGGQRENLLIALKDCATTQTVYSLREAHLIVTLLGFILPSVAEEDLTTLSAFGGLHAALLSLSAKICGPQDWVAKVQPSSDVEREEDQTLVLALRNNGTIFTEKVEGLVESLEAAILTYQTVATRKRADTNAFRPVLLPALKIQESAPTFGSAGAYLRDTAKVLAFRLSDATKLAGFLDNFEATPLEEIEEAFAFPEEDGLEAGDRRNRVLQELQALHTKYRLQVTSSLHLLELSLLLYFRHIAFFLDPERAEQEAASARPEFGLGLAESLRATTRSSHGLPSGGSISAFDLPALREGLANDFESVAEKLVELPITQKSAGSNYRAREAYIGLVVRRLQELLLLGQE